MFRITKLERWELIAFAFILSLVGILLEIN